MSWWQALPLGGLLVFAALTLYVRRPERYRYEIVRVSQSLTLDGGETLRVTRVRFRARAQAEAWCAKMNQHQGYTHARYESREIAR